MDLERVLQVSEHDAKECHRSPCSRGFWEGLGCSQPLEGG